MDVIQYLEWNATRPQSKQPGILFYFYKNLTRNSQIKYRARALVCRISHVIRTHASPIQQDSLQTC